MSNVRHPTGDPATALVLSSITKTFGQTRALDAASLTVRRNTIHALLGENGAGKTTLMRIAFGMFSPDSGTIHVNDEPHTFHSSANAIATGIGMVHQHFTLVSRMTVAENIALGANGRTRSFRYDATRAIDQVNSLSQRTGLPANPTAIVGTLPVAAQQRVEILKALAQYANILILDEPTAVLAPEESRDLLNTLRMFADNQGTVVLITHKLRDALEFSDGITVLRHGKTVLTGHTRTLDERQLTNAMIGGSTDHVAADVTVDIALDAAVDPTGAQHRAKHHVPVFRLRNVEITRKTTDTGNPSKNRNTLRRKVHPLNNVSLDIHPHEIVGIAAIEGSGQHELLRVLAGRLKASAGFVDIPDLVGFIPEDRHRDAMILDFSLSENIALFNARTHTGKLDWRNIKQHTANMMAKYDVRAFAPDTRASTLSGGNQQKLIVSREMEGAPKALVAENPTRGLDIQATRAVHQRLQAAKHQGAAIVVYSSDLDELIALADRIVVIHAGTLHKVPKDRTIIGHTMLSGTSQAKDTIETDIDKRDALTRDTPTRDVPTQGIPTPDLPS